MKKPKPPRPKMKKPAQLKQRHQVPPPLPQQEHQRTIGERIQNHPVVAVVALAAAVFGVAGPVWDALREPTVESEGSDPASPFALPFRVTNKGILFTMTRTEVECDIDKLMMSGRVGAENTRLSGASEIDIPPGDSALFHCPFNAPGFSRLNFQGDRKLISAHIFMTPYYKTLWFVRSGKPAEFTWYTYAKPPRWVMGKFAD